MSLRDVEQQQCEEENNRLMGADYNEKFPMASFVNEKIDCRGSKTHGFGLFAREPISQGETILIFAGKIVHKERLSELSESQIENTLQIQEDFFQIPFVESENKEKADFINHSCQPNCGFLDTAVLVALRDIETNEEVTYDYAMSDCYILNFACSCGSPCCREVITTQDWQKPEVYKAHYDYLMPYLRKKVDNLIKDNEKEKQTQQ